MRKPVVAKRVNIAVLNRKALERYREFWSAIQQVGEAVYAGEKVAAKAEDTGRISWSAPTADELRATGKSAARAVEVLARSAKKWEQELISREWRR